MTAVLRRTQWQPRAHANGLLGHSCSQQAYYAPVKHARSSPRNPCTKLHGSLLIYRPLRDGWLSWPCWLTDSGQLNHNQLAVWHRIGKVRRPRPAF